MIFDITICEGVDCPIKDSCFRHYAHIKAKESESLYVSVFLTAPYKDGKCDYYSKTKEVKNA